jgi:murein DD-endopeptidase MepM/ murein hydrolase activator NlpD
VTARVVAPVLCLFVLCTLAACGGDAGSRMPTTPVTPAVATVTLSQSEISIGSTGTAQVMAIARDANGATLTGRNVTWSSSNMSVAIVGETGLITAVAQGSSTITATVEGKTASVPLTVLDVVSIPAFQQPFAGDFLMSNFMDHDVPFEFVDDNGRFTTFWGEVHAKTGKMIDGHSGYDWTMPAGTPLLAVAAGTVTSASTSNAPFFCPLLNKDVTDMISVAIVHTLPGGVSVISRYLHLSRLDVSLGQVVAAGTQLGLSGNTGCSTGPHLHFETYRSSTQTKTGHVTTIDPYGWAASSVDPWETHADGAPSIYLWKAGGAPALRRGGSFKPGVTNFVVTITQLVFEGVRDDVNPNNEYVEVSLNPMLPSATLDGYQLRGDKSGVSYSLPQGITLTPAHPKIRIYTGEGTNSATILYMGRPSGIWSNLRSDDCVRLVSPTGAQFQINLGNGCPSLSASTSASGVMVELPKIRDFSPRQF